MGRRKGSKNKPKQGFNKAIAKLNKQKRVLAKPIKKLTKGLTKKYIVDTPAEKVHAKFGSPSNMKRTEECPGWIAFGKDIPETEATEYSKEGDVFHDIMEVVAPKYLTKASITDDLKKTPAEYTDMEDYVWVTLDKLEQLWNSFKGKHEDCQSFFELQVKLNEDTFGTSDVVFTGVNKKTGKTDVVAIDYKYGKGVFVSAEKNRQGITYLLATLTTLQITDPGVCVVIIAQVRLQDDWEENRFIIRGQEELEEWQSSICLWVDRAKEIYENPKLIKGNLHAGDHCRFCKCAPVCPEQKKRNFDPLAPMLVKAEEFIDVKGEDRQESLIKVVKKLSLDQQVEIFHKKSLIEDFLSAVASNLQRSFKSGITHKSLKLIRTNGRRKWRDDLSEEDIAKKLIKLGLNNPWTKKLIALTKAEKQVDVEKLIEVGEGRTELVSSSDKRKAITFNEPEEFEI